MTEDDIRRIAREEMARDKVVIGVNNSLVVEDFAKHILAQAQRNTDRRGRLGT